MHIAGTFQFLLYLVVNLQATNFLPPKFMPHECPSVALFCYLLLTMSLIYRNHCHKQSLGLWSRYKKKQLKLRIKVAGKRASPPVQVLLACHCEDTSSQVWRYSSSSPILTFQNVLIKTLNTTGDWNINHCETVGICHHDIESMCQGQEI